MLTMNHLLEQAAYGVDMFAMVILLYATVIASGHFIWGEFSSQILGGPDHRENIRLQLGGRMLFALELMIASDLIHTVLGRTIEDLTFLGVLVIIRTAISFFLAREIKEIEELKHALAK
ncbi:MAG: putative membrane protein [Candidatus Azotimanducaceae bacterium]|jgi:uncharacterized membrane protein